MWFLVTKSAFKEKLGIYCLNYLAETTDLKLYNKSHDRGES